MNLILYTRAGCHLCERLETMLRPHLDTLAEEGVRIDLERRDIGGDENWLNLYRERIPVLTLEGEVLLEGRPSESEVDAAVERVRQWVRDGGSIRRVYIARDVMEAHFLRSLLESRGIAAVVQGESLGTARGGVPMTQETLPSVWVDEADVEAAMEVVDSLQAVGAAAAEGEAWRCPRCGELVEPQFTECWKCGASREQSGDEG